MEIGCLWSRVWCLVPSKRPSFCVPIWQMRGNLANLLLNFMAMITFIWLREQSLHHLNTSQKKGIISQYTDALEIKFPAQKTYKDVSGHNKPTVVIPSCLKIIYALLLNFQIQILKIRHCLKFLIPYIVLNNSYIHKNKVSEDLRY